MLFRALLKLAVPPNNPRFEPSNNQYMYSNLLPERMSCFSSGRFAFIAAHVLEDRDSMKYVYTSNNMDHLRRAESPRWLEEGFFTRFGAPVQFTSVFASEETVVGVSNGHHTGNDT
jgi:hypothetical protein